MRSTYLNLGREAASNCSASTQEQIKKVVDRLSDDIDSEAVIANLSESQNHIKLGMTKMKMDASVHDFPNYGITLADIYTTLSGQ